MHRLPCIFLFVFSWPKVLAQSPTSLLHTTSWCATHTWSWDVSLIHAASWRATHTWNWDAITRYIQERNMLPCCFSFHFFCTFFSSSNNSLVSPIHFSLPWHTFSFIYCTNLFSLIYFIFIYFIFPFICLLIFLLFLSRCFLYFITHFILLCFPYLHKFIIDSLEKSKGG